MLARRGSTPERSDPQAMVQQGQTFELTRCGPDGERLWAYRYRTGGRDSKRVQRGGFASEQDARDALERELERLRRERRITRRLTLSQFVETYLDQHDVQPVTIDKLRYLLSKDRKSTRLNSSHVKISYAVFCLKKKMKH